MNRALWIAQGLLAATFLFAGGMKLVLPVEMLTKQVPLPGWFLRATGTVEVLGALGLILPGALGIAQGLTWLAAAGLVVVTIGATILTLAVGGGLSALFPAAVGLVALFVAYGRAPFAASERGRLDADLTRPR